MTAYFESSHARSFPVFDRRYVPLGALALLDFPRLDNKGGI